jgi:hypothetical protein
VTCRASLLLATLAGVLVTGCSGGSDKPGTLPPITPTPSPSASSTPTPTDPAATPVSLEAFVRFYFKQLNVAFSTNDAALIRRYSDPICKTCNNYAASIAGRMDEYIRGESFALTEVAVPPLGTGVTNVEVFGTVPARAVVNRSGNVMRLLPTDGQFHFIVSVAREGKTWRVASIGQGT